MSAFRNDKIDHVNTWIDTWHAGGTFPAMMLGVFNQNGDELFHYATREIGEEGFVYDRDTIFRIYSMTKPITAAAVLILMDRKLLSLEDCSIDEQVTTEPLHTPITILHLLTHTSGISYGIFGNHFSDETLKKKVPNEDWKNWFRYTPLTELCEHIASTPICFQPGKHFLYGLNFEILGRVIEIVSGCTLDVFLYENIFKPLGMRNMGFTVCDKVRLPRCYEVDARRASYKLCEREELFAQRDAILLVDYERFSRCLLGGGALGEVRVLSEQAVQLMTSNQLPNNALMSDMVFGDMFSELKSGGFGYGLGVSVLCHPADAQGCGLSVPGEFGWGGVASTFFYVDPVRKTSVIFLTQLIPSSANIQLRAQIRWLTHWLLDHKSHEG
eukprot:gene22195-28736_t